MKMFGKILIGGLFLAAGTYGVAYALRQKKLLSNTSFDNDKITAKKIGINNSSITANVKVTNMSDISYTINSLKTRAYLNGIDSGEVIVKIKTTIPAKSSEIIPVDIDFSPAKAIGGIFSTKAFDLNKINLQLVGTASVSSGLLMINSIPVDVSFNLGDMFLNS